MDRDYLLRQRQNWMKERQLEKDKKSFVEESKDADLNPAQMLDRLAIKVSERLTNEMQGKAQYMRGNPKTMQSGAETELTTEVMSNTCPICLELFLPPANSPILLFPCGHTFCKLCLSKLLKVKKKCPCCRTPIQSQAINISLQNLICTANDQKESVAPVVLPAPSKTTFSSTREEYMADEQMLNVRIKVLEDELIESQGKMKYMNTEILSRSTVIKSLLAEEGDAKMRLEKIKDELRLVQTHLQSQNTERDKLSKDKNEINQNIELIQQTLGSLYQERKKLSLFISHS